MSSFREEAYPPAELSFSNYSTTAATYRCQFRLNTPQRSDIHTTPFELDNVLRSLAAAGQPDGNANGYCRQAGDAIRVQTGSLFRETIGLLKGRLSTYANMSVHASMFVNDRSCDALTRVSRATAISKEIPNQVLSPPASDTVAELDYGLPLLSTAFVKPRIYMCV